MRLKVQASIVESLEAQLKAELSPQQKAQLQGLVSRGIKAAEICVRRSVGRYKRASTLELRRRTI